MVAHELGKNICYMETRCMVSRIRYISIVYFLGRNLICIVGVARYTKYISRR